MVSETRITVAILSGNPLIGRVLELLLGSVGYEVRLLQETKASEVKDLLEGIGKGVNPGPTFEEGFAVQAVLDAVERSVETHDWAKPETA